MIKRHFIWPLISGFVMLNSCSDEFIVAPSETPSEEEFSYAIPIEDALSSLGEFLYEEGIVRTKGDIGDYIDNYFAVSDRGVTKAVKAPGIVLYAVNFRDGGGYALLSADSRIPEDILAVTDSGCVTEDDFVESPFEMIPNENDDLSVEEYNEMVESGVLAQKPIMVSSLCLDYAITEIENGAYLSGASGEGNVSDYRWEVEKEVPMMLETVWAQEGKDGIFHKYCPTVGFIWRQKAPAGCVSIAISQIVAFHEYPAGLECNGVYIDYSSIKEIYNFDYRFSTGTSVAREMLAQFIACIGAFCNTKYHCCFGASWAFAWPKDAVDCLRILGYKNVILHYGYDEDKVLESLDNGCPVFAASLPPKNPTAGHAWVIDGYMKRKYVSRGGAVSKRQTLVHCNWGWGGNRNGYFTSGVFRTGDAVIDDGFGGSIDDTYSTNNILFRYITYEKTIQ